MKKLLLTLCLVSSVGLASDNLFSGLYIGVNVGQSFNQFSGLVDNLLKDSISPFKTDTFNGYDYPANDWRGNLEVGYKFNQYIGIEGNWLINPKNINVKYSLIRKDYYSPDTNYNLNFEAKFNQQIVDGLVTASLPIHNFLITAKGGLGEVFDGSVSFTKNNKDYKFDQDYFNNQMIFVAGGDIGYKITDHLIADVDYSHYFKNGNFESLNYVGVGLQYIL